MPKNSMEILLTLKNRKKKMKNLGSSQVLASIKIISPKLTLDHSQLYLINLTQMKLKINKFKKLKMLKIEWPNIELISLSKNLWIPCLSLKDLQLIKLISYLSLDSNYFQIHFSLCLKKKEEKRKKNE